MYFQSMADELMNKMQSTNIEKQIGIFRMKIVFYLFIYLLSNILMVYSFRGQVATENVTTAILCDNMMALVQDGSQNEERLNSS